MTLEQAIKHYKDDKDIFRWLTELKCWRECDGYCDDCHHLFYEDRKEEPWGESRPTCLLAKWKQT